MAKDKYALFDTDFISKMYTIQKDEENHLIDRIIELPGYHFYCHAQIRTEVARHNISGSKKWLEDKTSEGKIVCYGDEDIFDELELVYGRTAILLYMDFLKKACEAYQMNYYENNFKELQKLDYKKITKDDFLKNWTKIVEISGLITIWGK